MLLEVQNISKSFPGVKALDNVSLSFYPSQINAILGENGAGKSTLLKILTGVYTPDDGIIKLDGKEVRFESITDAQEAGISIIHQELSLIPQLTISENLFLGREIRSPFGFLASAEMERQTRTALARVHLDLAPDTLVGKLKVGEQQLIEIAKALMTDARVILMDEPTSALSDSEIENLHGIIKRLKGEGKTIVYISHKMEELFRIVDHYVVLRDGNFMGAGSIDETNSSSLIQMMVGRDIQVQEKTMAETLGSEVMIIEDLRLRHTHMKERYVLQDISFSLRKREILGIFGLMGAGRTELLETIFGVHPKISSYTLIVDGQRTLFDSPQAAIAHGLAFVTEDRKEEGLILGMDISSNISLPNISQTPLLKEKKEKNLAREYIGSLGIKTPSENQLCENLSGGNQQKVVLAKWLSTDPQILLMDEPTRGIDIKAKQEIYELMKQLVKDGLSIILVSSEIPEIMALTDRILVMSEGKLTAEFITSQTNEHEILKAALPE